MRPEDEDTVEYVGLDDACLAAFFGGGNSPLAVSVGGVTHQGLVRADNQDHFLVARRIRRREVLLTSLPLEALPVDDEEAWLLLIADGMGGGAFGEVASRLVVTRLWELSGHAASWLMQLHDEQSREPYIRMRLYLNMVQQAFRDARTSGLLTEPSGTTCTCAYIIGRHALIANVGDSRAYLFRDGRLNQLTRDHTVAQQLIEAGMPAERARDFGNILTSHLGTHSSDVDLHVNCVRLDPDDSVLVCSDGLTNAVSEPTIAAELGRGTAPQERCERLVQLALDAGGRDNITVAIASFRAG